MDVTHWDGDLVAYIQGLIDAAAPKRAVLQFNRVDFRLPWLRRWFPEARIVHLYRHPRDQWCSSLVTPESFPATASMNEFPPHDHYYLLMWARDLRYRFPFLDETAVDHPYELFYLIWKLSWLFGRQYADCSVCLERLVQHPIEELRTLLAAVGATDVDPSALTGHIVDRSRGRWRGYAEDAWFRKREMRCEAVLRRWRTCSSG